MPSFLSQYPRPPADTGWGFHDSAGARSFPAVPAALARYLHRDLGITWFKALVSGTNKVGLVRAFIEEGIEVIVRLYAGEPHPHYVVSPGEIAGYAGVGVHYFEWGNEPNLLLEWNRAEWDRGARVEKVCEQFLRNADVIRRAGGIPLMVALSPGGDYPHRDWYRSTFEWLRAHNHLSDLDGAALAVHNRPFNRTLAHSDPNGCCFLDYEWIDDLVRHYLGRSLPLLGTESGCEPGWCQDPTFPPVDLQRHAAHNVEILRGFGPYGSRRWRDSLFCQCLWLVDSFGHPDYAESAWHNNLRWAGGGNLPGVAALRAEWQAHPFERRPSWESGQADYPPATWRGSPNADPRPTGCRPELVVLYPTGGGYYATIQRMQDPASEVSYHYVVARTGSVAQLVPEAQRAWHAGDSVWEGRRVNDYAVAVGLAEGSRGAGDYPAEQLDGAAALVRYLQEKHGIELQNVLTTSIITGADPAPGLDLEAFHGRLAGIERTWPPDEVVRAAAWAAANVPYQAEAVFARYARERRLGNPETSEFEFQLDGRLYHGQGFAEGIVYAESGRWDDVGSMLW